ncbi:MAG: hypothetical protein IOC82_12835 [Aestuariivirga sp.]|uniref:hypothetical protein n=1 Tax=Aestuariivirga sp. TaxID=2650926 RepID=UPI0025C56E9A|nr:hypothetical protein [Aestuariivirga sp.]MCA3561902.1 hypothetical protein [Aestuariivirga sp.]
MKRVTLESPSLEVTVNPQLGGAITAVRHKPTGLSVLGTVPWDVIEAPLPSLAARDEPEWLTRYSGGWPLLFPNGGDACTVDGVFHGFHGEASLAPWEAEQAGGALVLTRRFATLAATMRRRMRVDGETLTIAEDLSYDGDRSAEVMWGHHPTFGGDLLAAPVEITCAAQHVQCEAQFDPPANPIAPGAGGLWPMLPAKTGGRIDLAHPQQPWACVAYLTGFAFPWAAIRRMDDAIAVLLTWDGARFPCAWLWYELEATPDAPWNGRTRLIGIEPNTTPCALGLGEAIRRRAPLLRLKPGAHLSASITLHVFKPRGPVNGPAGIGTQQGTKPS